jgi:hypothetical protein
LLLLLCWPPTGKALMRLRADFDMRTCFKPFPETGKAFLLVKFKIFFRLLSFYIWLSPQKQPIYKRNLKR